MTNSNIGFINETVTCAHDIYNAELVRTGKASTIKEAASIPRHLTCSCNKCKVKY